MHFYIYQTAIGVLTLCEEKGCITAISTNYRPETGEEKETETIRRAYTQITEYLEGKRKIFDLPLAATGTEFQKRVWKALSEIPYGETRTYGEIAAAIGNPKAARAVGMANHRNPLMIVVPCHRVIGSNGKMTGYASGLDTKEFLLKLERKMA